MLISSDLQLRKYIPNAFATVEGEVSLFEKLSPWLEEAECFVANHFTGEELIATFSEVDSQESLRSLTARIIVSHAFLGAIPSLDLVLTPNGFGIVNNQNVVPASKDRVERLMNAIERQRDDAVILLLKGLRRNTDWQQSEVFGYWSQTLFPNIEVCERIGKNEHRLEEYRRLRPRIIAIETELANAFISTELMDDLHRYQFGIGYEELSPAAQSARAYLLTRLHSEILAQLEGQPLRPQYMADVVNFIRNNTEAFPQWENSATAQLFSPPVFENKRNAQGYFF